MPAIYLNKLVLVVYFSICIWGMCDVHCNYELSGQYVDNHTHTHIYPPHTHTYTANIYCFLSGLGTNILIFLILSFDKKCHNFLENQYFLTFQLPTERQWACGYFYSIMRRNYWHLNELSAIQWTFFIYLKYNVLYIWTN